MSEMPIIFSESAFSASTTVHAYIAGKTLPKSFYACRNREAALLSLCHAKPADIDYLLSLTRGEWRALLRWLDASGLTPYMANHIAELNLQEKLPNIIKQQLQRELVEHRAQMESVLQESLKIQAEFQRANLCYAAVENLSFLPSSAQRPVLGSQPGVEYLVDENDARMAREILEAAGYRLDTALNTTWEFRKNNATELSRKNMDQDGCGCVVTLHIETVVKGCESWMTRREFQEIEGITMPVLAPADLFLRQGMRVFDGVCSPFLRASHLLEFYLHVCARADDPAFWSQVRSLAEEDTTTVFGLGVVLNLIESVMEGEIPAKLVIWTMLRIPEGVQRWTDMYGPNCVYGMAPGNKLYLLLQREMERAGVSLRPDGVLRQKSQEETVRHATSLRMRFHVVESLRYAWTSFRWQRFGDELPA